MMILLLLSFGLLQLSFSDDCDELSTCAHCTDKFSWSLGVRCRWCPLDRGCHAYASLVNPCKPEQNIATRLECKTKVYEHYKPRLAYEQALYSTAAYSDDPQACLDEIFPRSKFEIVDVISADCDDFLFDYGECFAYTAVSLERKAILIAFRGTNEVSQLVDQILTVLAIPKTEFMAGGNVQKYFYNAFEKLYPCVSDSGVDLVKKYPDFDVQITGHSLGGAIASLSSAALVHDKIVPQKIMSLYTFGMPRVGDKEYAAKHDRLVSNSWRVVHYKDPVSHLPLCNFLTGCDITNGPYHHRAEVFYPSAYMSRYSSYEICTSNEDKRCSDGLMTDDPCLIDITRCIDYHLEYFSVPIGTYCEQVGKANRTDTNGHQKMYNHETCQRMKLKTQKLKSSRGVQIGTNLSFWKQLFQSFIMFVYLKL